MKTETKKSHLPLGLGIGLILAGTFAGFSSYKIAQFFNSKILPYPEIPPIVKELSDIEKDPIISGPLEKRGEKLEFKLNQIKRLKDIYSNPNNLGVIYQYDNQISKLKAYNKYIENKRDNYRGLSLSGTLIFPLTGASIIGFYLDSKKKQRAKK